MKRLILISLALLLCGAMSAQRTERLLEKGWKFTKSDPADAFSLGFDDHAWQSVVVPHDWAIYGPFDKMTDHQIVRIVQNGDEFASEKFGRTGGLPYIGVGWYRLPLDVEGFDPARQCVTLVFDGAMSEAKVYVNGEEACFWPLGYNSFHVDVTGLLNKDGRGNTLAVRLENRPYSSRWYSGAGLYRNVRLVVTDKVHVPVWGTYLTTPHVEADYASVRLEVKIDNAEGKKMRLKTRILNPAGKEVAVKDNTQALMHGMPLVQNFTVARPELWSPESPLLYKAVTEVYDGERLTDTYTTRFGIRKIEYIADKGFFLNGKHRKFQGACNHHDLGPLGAVANMAGMRRQLMLLKDMGCDAIRTSHNMPAPELVELCDEMGFMMMIEPFDEWDIAKCENGYHRFFEEWAEKDLVNMLHHYRNNPSVVMWSVGNEVPSQCSPDGYKVAKFLQDICHREDPTRPVTCGMDRVDCVLDAGMAAVVDIPGFNYRPFRYEEAYARLPQNLVLGSETASTVSSRGVYKFPVVKQVAPVYDDHQCCSYDMTYAGWANIPDDDFVMADDFPWTIGQFIWTGFDYLGEPTPYDKYWPNHSSMFGAVDLASIPKDRFYLYRSVWNRSEPTLHVLPHWTWPGRKGQVTPVFVYTSYSSAELFINGKSYGMRYKNDSTNMNRYRLMWMNAVYEPGEVKVVAYDKSGKACGEQVVRTAGKPHHIELTPDRREITADGRDLSYINVRVVDVHGNPCPADSRTISFHVTGAGSYRAAANGDPTCLELFHLPQMSLFSGQLTAIVQSGEAPGTITFEATAKGVQPAKVEIAVK